MFHKYANNADIRVIISQDINGQEQINVYWIKCPSKHTKNYCTTRKELLAIVKSTKHFYHYLYVRKFLPRTDYTSLTWFLNLHNLEGQIARWVQQL